MIIGDDEQRLNSRWMKIMNNRKKEDVGRRWLIDEDKNNEKNY